MNKWIISLIVSSAFIGVGMLQWMHRRNIEAEATPRSVFAQRATMDTAGRPTATSTSIEIVSRGYVPAQEESSARSHTPSLVKPPSNGIIPASIQPIVNPDVDMEFSERLEAVHALGTNLTTSEIALLYDYLLTSNSATTPGRRSEELLRNDVMNKLVGQEILPAGLADLLIRIYDDRQQDVVMRDYAVQQLPTVYAQLSDGERTTVADALRRATTETDNSIAGTALLALVEITSGSVVATAGPVDAADRTQLAQTALTMAEDPDCGELARITAVSICGRIGVTEALPVTSQLAETANSIPLRIAAIAALGDLGIPETQAVLERLSRNSEKRLRTAAESALVRLKKRS
jgi:hypothetical protein